MASSPEDAYVTLLTSHGYLPGAMVLAHSLRDNATTKKLVAMVTTDSMSADVVDELRTVYDTIIPVERVRNRSPANLYLMNRPDLDSAFTKIQLWKQTQYRKIVYVDADVVSIRAPDDLFQLPHPFSAAPDIGWPDLFNSGVMVLTPNMGDYYALLALAERGISFDGADQGLLNMHFKNYNRISFTYNCTPSGHYQYLPAYRHFQSTISMVHFIGESKPWRVGREFGGSSGAYPELLGRWWATYDRHYRGSAAAVMSGHAPPNSQIVQKFVAGEQLLPPGYSSSSQPPPAIHVEHVESDANYQENVQLRTEEPTAESSANAQFGGEPQPISAPTTNERRFTAPHAEWNPAVQPPPSGAKPEAANFPQHIYSMSADKELFQPPASYPEPPKDMYYQVPEKRLPTKPKPIFPWEENQTPPTRVFRDEPEVPRAGSAPKPRPEPLQLGSPVPVGDEFSVSPPQESAYGPGSTHASIATNRNFDEPMTPFSPTQVPFTEYRGSNAWDDDERINRYVTAFQNHRKNGSQTSAALGYENILSPTGEMSKKDRARSMRITNFPTEIERPSLPVTPAPIRRNMFWGSERDAQGNLPEAEGVPGQNEWDPEQQLEQLRRNSLLFAEEPSATSPDAPLRNLPRSSRSIETSTEQEQNREELVSRASNTASFSASTSQHSGGDGSNARQTIWVDHESAGKVFEEVSRSVTSTSAFTPSYAFQRSEPVGPSASVNDRTAVDPLGTSPSPTQEEPSETIRKS